MDKDDDLVSKIIAVVHAASAESSFFAEYGAQLMNAENCEKAVGALPDDWEEQLLDFKFRLFSAETENKMNRNLAAEIFEKAAKIRGLGPQPIFPATPDPPKEHSE